MMLGIFVIGIGYAASRLRTNTLWGVIIALSCIHNRVGFRFQIPCRREPIECSDQPCHVGVDAKPADFSPADLDDMHPFVVGPNTAGPGVGLRPFNGGERRPSCFDRRR